MFWTATKTNYTTKYLVFKKLDWYCHHQQLLFKIQGKQSKWHDCTSFLVCFLFKPRVEPNRPNNLFRRCRFTSYISMDSKTILNTASANCAKFLGLNRSAARTCCTQGGAVAGTRQPGAAWRPARHPLSYSSATGALPSACVLPYGACCLCRNFQDSKISWAVLQYIKHSEGGNIEEIFKTFSQKNGPFNLQWGSL